MDITLAILSGLLILIGIIGSVLPVLPGTPLCWLGLLVLHFSKYANYTTTFLVVMASVMIVVSVLDYLIPVWGTKRFGGSKAGVMGSTIGLIVGLFFGPVGIILGPFIGAFLGEMLVNKTEFKGAMKSATGSFIGFLLSTGLKLIYGGFTAFYFFKAIF
ncbi:DUF456 domain-containing protein [Cryomorpha ignava]|uniref:DUF456 domain-containing protein n=1 Tax=Cryomorpha ignava TaxID=101383 RepID=A0A7K3WML5_9FLAO|nr:DUF456 domain-containing protein [Cryomorpha ignava]NEN22889.1 DUF456 domain-containing protein [Cryomorpha ignava]